MNMRNALMMAVLLATGCLVPLDVSGDGGDAETPHDGGATDGGEGCEPTVDAGGIDWSNAPCHLGTPAPQETGAVTLLFPGCREMPQVVGALGPVPVVVGSDSFGTTVSSSQWPPGIYLVSIGAGAARQSVTFEVYEHQRLDVGTVRTYIDPIDTCGIVELTNEGRLVCQRVDQVVVYETDGGLHTSFAGNDVAVVGNEVWSRGGGGIELRIDGPSGVTLAASMVDARLMDPGPVGATTPGRTLRGGAGELIEFSWDGSALASRSWPIGLSGGFVFRDGETFWTEDLCTCTNGLCAGTDNCPFVTYKLLGLASDRLWAAEALASSGPLRLVELIRPLSATHPRIFRPVPLLTAGFPRISPAHHLPVFRLASPSTQSVILVGPASGLTHFRVMSEPVLANTPRFVISSVSSSTVRFTAQQ